MQSQPPQPPKQATYTQPTNPVSQTPLETQRKHGDNVPTITRRTASSNPSNPSSLAESNNRRQASQERLQKAPNVDLEYGVELQPNEGAIADAVETKSQGQGGRKRAQAGAHAGPVGTAEGPGYPASASASGSGSGSGEGGDLVADLERKREEHDRVIRGRDVGVDEREEVRQRKLEADREVDVKKAVEEGTGDRVVGVDK